MADRLDLHCAAFGELHGVGGEIQQHLADAGGIAAQCSRQTGVEFDLHGQPLVAGIGADHRRDRSTMALGEKSAASN